MKHLMRIALLSISLGACATAQVGSIRPSGDRGGSGLRIASNAQFNVTTPLLNARGATFGQGTTSNITGNPLSSFTLRTGNNNTTIQGGTYDPATSRIGLFGGGRVTTSGGTSPYGIDCSGASNVISGDAVVTGNVTFADPATSCTLALTTPLQQSLNLNGGVLQLGSSLSLADEVKVEGGTVDVNMQALAFGGRYSTPWSGATIFLSPADLRFNGYINLTGQWILQGEGDLNGNGNVLDLLNGGTFIVDSGSTIGITDLTLRNIEQDSIIFIDTTSTLALSDVHLEITTSITTTVGNFFIYGPATFIIKDKTWTFSGTSELTVDGVTLLIDIGLSTNTLPLVVSPNLENNGTIQRYVDITQGGNFSITLINLFAGIFTSTNLTLSISTIINQTNAITIGANVVLDALGGVLIFTNPNSPQLIILDGSTLTLKNITLLGINGSTFSFGPTSSLIIGENVFFGFASDVSLTSGSITITGTTNVWNVFGEHGMQQFLLEPGRPGQTSVIDLGSNTMRLNNIELINPHFISWSSKLIGDQLIRGAVALSGNTLVDVSTSLDLNFVIEDFNNNIRLLADALFLSGSILWADFGVNELNFFSSIVGGNLTPGLNSGGTINPVTTSDFFGSNLSVIPSVHLADDYIFLSSLLGQALLNFPDYAMDLIHLGGNSFVIGEHGFLDGNNLGIFDFPIKAISSIYAIGQGLVLTGNIINPIDDTFIQRSEFLRLDGPHFTTALHIQQMKEHNKLQSQLEEQKKATLHQQPRGKQRPQIPSSKQKPSKRRDLDTINFDTRDIDLNLLAFSREVDIPPFFDRQINNSTQLGNAQSNILVLGGEGTEFSVDPDNPLNIVLANGGAIRQGITSVMFKDSDALQVVGLGNVVEVRRSFEINGDFKFHKGSELTVVFNDAAGGTPVLMLKKGFILEPGVILRFSGRGVVIIDGDIIIQMNIKDPDTGDLLPPQLLVTNYARFDVAAGRTGTIRGSGIIEVLTGGKIGISHIGKLFIGATATDEITLRVISGAIDLNALDPLMGTAQMSLAKGTFTVDIEQAGQMNIGSRGLFEVNTRNGVLAQGTLTELNFALGGALFVDQSGILRLGDGFRNVRKTFSFDALTGRIGGTGIIEYQDATVSRSFTGRISNLTSDFNIISNTITLEQLATLLIQRKTGLLVSTFYQTPDGSFAVRTSIGVIIPLSNTQEVIGDNAQGDVFVFDSATNEYFRYNAAGQSL